MDVLQPELVWIENRCYRIKSTKETQQSSQQRLGYVEADLESEEEDIQIDYEINRTGANSFNTSFHVPSAFHGNIIGQKGATRKRLENETRSLIQVPQRGSQGPIVVTAQRETDVVAARKKIEDIVASARQRNDITHFLSVPCCNDSVKATFGQFREAVLAALPADCLPEMVQIPEKLHMTLSVMILMDDKERTLAKDLLHGEQDAIRAILADFGGKAEVTIRGVDIMNDDPEATKVVYAKVESEALQRIADHLDGAFRKKRLGKSNRHQDSVKLHMTVINSAFAAIEQEEPKKFVPFVTFNSSRILQEFKDVFFGSFPLTEIHLSQRTSFDDKGYYRATTILSL
ncbi:activating signal cointegrator 1 complex subunit 1-like [Phlebotomus argentipes]|uniref:activating signal cointegrator 1 complex subunit 1-like n=1 Tax=Phlebotomus argentipes TaxID=94469 RepID=UPI0028931322|nr:activating signal cointegrator 1 complex subunit 1-like [Phlebotomus argentipes]